MAMSTITINFQNAALTTSTSQIVISGGSFGLDTTSALSMTGTISFTSLYVTAGAINFNVPSGTTFNASVVVPVDASTGAPTLTITNFSGMVTIMWPTTTGPQIQAVTAGDPLTLNGFVN